MPRKIFRQAQQIPVATGLRPVNRTTRWAAYDWTAHTDVATRKRGCTAA